MRRRDALDRLLAMGEGASLAVQPVRDRLARLAAAQAERTRARPLTWGSLYAALAVALSVAAVDRPLALLLKAHVGGDVQGFFRVVTHLGLAGVYLIPAGLAALAFWLAARRAVMPEIRRRRALWAWRLTYFFAAVAVPSLTADLIKVVVGRARPRLLFEHGFYGVHPFSFGWAWASFPSGHSTTAWGAAVALVVLVPRYDLLWLLLALLVSASRVALTVHYLGDVTAGAWLGTVGAILLARGFARRGVTL